MDLLDFARGPALQVAIYVFIAGSLWRVLGVLLLQRKPDHSDPRQPGGFRGALKVIWSRSFTAPAFAPRTKYPKVLGYVLHIGLFITVFFFVPHIVFIKDLLGIGWPGLPNNAIYFVGVITVAVGIALLITLIFAGVAGVAIPVLFERLDLGTNFSSYDKAKPGDFLKIFWNDNIGKGDIAAALL